LLRWHTGQSGVHRTCPVNYSGLAVVNSRSWRVPEAPFLGAPDSPVNYSGVASGFSRRWRVWLGVLWCTGHCPVAHRTVRWIIAESPLDFPEGDEFDLESSGAPDTVRWCTGHCPVAHRTVRCARPEVPSVAPLLFCWTQYLVFLFG
jgi:hypothetical protein